MKIVMIHEVNDEILNINFDDFDVITFDDGLYSQYLYKDHFSNIGKKCIFFINPSIICPEDVKQSEKYITCANAHKKAFKGNYEDYMKMSQINELKMIKNFEIGSHSYNHVYFKSIKDMIDDYKKSVDFFKKNDIIIKSYCFPYNQDSKKKYFYNILKKYDIDLYGDGRIPVETLK